MQLSEGIPGLTSLKELNLSNCGSLASLPEGIAGLTSLRKLDLSSCSAVLAPGLLKRIKANGCSVCQ